MTTFLGTLTAWRAAQRMALALSILVHVGATSFAQEALPASASVPVATDAAVEATLPAASTAAGQEAFLARAKVTKVRGVTVGVTGTNRATLAMAGQAHDAHIQTVDQAIARFTSARGTELNFRDYWGYNVAAYRLGTLLGLDNIPPSIERRFRSQQGAFTWWVDDVLMDERARAAGNVEAPDRSAWSAQIQMMRVFDELIANRDRNQGNMLIDRNWKVWLIDHSRAFRLQPALENPAVIRRCDRRVFDRLKALTAESLKAATGRYLTGAERAAVLARRDRLVERIESLGAAALFDPVR